MVTLGSLAVCVLDFLHTCDCSDLQKRFLGIIWNESPVHARRPPETCKNYELNEFWNFSPNPPDAFWRLTGILGFKT